MEPFDHFEIFDAMGRLILQQKMDRQKQITINLSKQNKGFYYLVGISRKGEKYAYKILLQ